MDPSPSAHSPAAYVDFGWSAATACDSAAYVDPQIFALAGAAVARGARVLDMGCGNGALAGRFLSRGCQVVGVDLSATGVAAARKAHPDARFERLAVDGDVLAELGEAPFDLVVSTEVIEHLYAPLQYLLACHGALRRGGRLILSTPYHGYLKNVAIAAAGGFDTHVQSGKQGGHIKFWSRSSLGSEMTKAGFRDLRFRGAGRLPFLWKSMVMSGDRAGK